LCAQYCVGESNRFASGEFCVFQLFAELKWLHRLALLHRAPVMRVKNRRDNLRLLFGSKKLLAHRESDFVGPLSIAAPGQNRQERQR
jgi:hypothetical protein